jgi:ribulose-5-phosphate 4-epimerase/fuculose-1-phosphate aldolase
MRYDAMQVVLDGGETFLINRFGLLWSEVTAENLVEFDATGEIVSGDGPIYAGAGVTHTKVHGYRPENVCCLHLHPPWITALACVEGGLKLVGEVSARFAEPGMFLDDTEPAPAWGNTDSHRILLHPGHGVTCCGPSVAEALDDLLALEAAARLQLLQMGISAARAQPLPVLDAAETIVIMKPWFEGLDKTEEATQALAALAAANTPPSPPNWDGTGPFPSRIQGPEGAATDLAAACRLLNHWGWCDEANGSYTQVALDGNTFMVGDGSMPYATATPESLDATGSPQFGFLLKARGIQATAVIYAHPPSLSDMAQSGEEFLSSVPSPKSPVAYGCTLEDMADAMALAGNECCENSFMARALSQAISHDIL